MDASGVVLQIRDHVTLVITGTLFLAMAVRLIRLARGNPAALALLIQEADLVQVLLSVLTGVVVILTVIAAGTCVLTLVTSRNFALWFGLVVSLAFAAHVVPFAAFALGAGLYVAGGVFLWWVSRKLGAGGSSSRRLRVRLERLLGYLPTEGEGRLITERMAQVRDLYERGYEDEARAVLEPLESTVSKLEERQDHVDRKWWFRVQATWSVSIAFILLFFLLWGGSWMPTENIELDDGAAVVAYVVSDDGPWTHLLTVNERDVISVPSEAVTSRQACTTRDVFGGRQWLAISLVDVLQGAASADTELCDL